MSYLDAILAYIHTVMPQVLHRVLKRGLILRCAALPQVEILYTGGSSAEHLIGSTDDKGSWLDGLLLRRLRVLAEGVRGGGPAGIARSRHRTRGAGAGDVCIPPAGKATSGFSHGCKSRLLVLDGPVSRLLEGVLAGDLSSGPPVAEQEVRPE